MDWQLAIAINVMALSAFSIVFSLLRWRLADKSWIALNGLILIAGAAGLYTGFAHTGVLLAAVFLPLILLPGYLVARGNRAMDRSEYAKAARFIKAAATLHPSAKLRFNADFAKAYTAADGDGVIEALRNLRGSASPSYQRLVDASIARLDGNWHGVLAAVRGWGREQPELIAYELRALGELGRTDEMVEAYRQAKPLLYGDGVRTCQLFVLAFCGRPDAVSLLAHNNRGSSGMHAEFASYWLAVAKAHAAEMRDEGLTELRQLADTTSLPNLRRAANAALLEAMRPHAPLSQKASAEAAALANRWLENKPLMSASLRTSYVTLALLLANAVMFALEYAYGGPENVEALYRLGALWPDAMSDPRQWWRVVAAMFLHFGWAHLILNMLSLALLGRMVEAAFGHARMPLIYAVSGLGSMATVVALMRAGVVEADFLVGASGAIMGLIGAWGGRVVRQYFSSRDVIDRRQVAALAVIMLGQFAIDLSVPQVSFTAHASGFLCGLGVALLLGVVADRRRSQA